jgi:anthranilate phosphoribosyltransferase
VRAFDASCDDTVARQAERVVGARLARVMLSGYNSFSGAAMSDILQVIKALCADAQMSTPRQNPVSPALMRGAFAAILDGGSSDLETGALMAAAAAVEARRDAVPYSELVLGLHDAIDERMVFLDIGAHAEPTVVLPNYRDEGRRAALPLLALLLRRMGIRVLIHGAIETYGGLFNCGVLREFGILPATTRGQATMQLAESGIAIVPATLYSPGLAAMLSLRNRLGIATPAHYLANLLIPVRDRSQPLLHVLHAPAWLSPGLESESLLRDAKVLLLTSSASSEAAEDGRPKIAFCDVDASSGWQVLFDEERAYARMVGGAVASVASAIESVPAAGDPRAWAAWTRLQLTGKLILPASMANVLASCLFACGYAADLNQAKAIAAVETKCLAAA